MIWQLISSGMPTSNDVAHLLNFIFLSTMAADFPHQQSCFLSIWAGCLWAHELTPPPRNAVDVIMA